MPRYAQILGWGKYVPERILTNDELAKMVDTSDEWIRSRTGIKERRIAGNPKETTATMAIAAGQAALQVADLPADQIDLIIVATSSPEYLMPATASVVQDALGASNAGAFDLNAACSGFVYALNMGQAAITSGQSNTVLVIGSDTMSRLVDWSDRGTCVLFGDGAGAVLLAASEQPGGILSTIMGSDGSGCNALIIPAGGSHMPATAETVAARAHYIKMDGQEVFRFATNAVAEAVQQVAERANLTMNEIKLIVPHQANARIIMSCAKRMKVSLDKFFLNVEKYGNTSAASIPIALCEAVEQGRIQPNDKVIVVGFGAGLTWAATALQWGVPVTYIHPGWMRAQSRRFRLWLARMHIVTRRWKRRLDAWYYGPAPTLVIQQDTVQHPETALPEPSRNGHHPPELPARSMNGNSNGRLESVKLESAKDKVLEKKVSEKEK